MRGARWQVYLMDRDLIGGIDLETVEKLVERIRRGAVNAIRADCAKTLAEAKATARRRAVMFKGEATGDAV
jgi:response regulator of citrate/malate metabolism